MRLRAVALAGALVGCATPPAAPEGGGAEEPAEPVAPPEVEPQAGAEAGRDGAEPAVEGPVETAKLGEATLTLAVQSCTLTAETKDRRVEHRFEFPAECHLSGLAAEDEGVRVVETETGPASIVESSRPLANEDCDTALRVVVMTDAGPKLSRGVQRVAMCTPFEWDEMMFHVLASDPVDFGTPAE